MISLPTFKILVGPARKTDGLHATKVRVTFKRVIRHIPTTVVAEQHEVSKSGRITNRNKVNALNELLCEMRDAVQGLNLYQLQTMTPDQLVSYIAGKLEGNKPFELDFIAYARQAIENKSGMDSTKKGYFVAVNNFCRFLKKDSIDIRYITSSLLRSYDAYLRKTYGENARCVSSYPTMLAHIHRIAREEFNNEEMDEVRIRNPFLYFHPANEVISRHRYIELRIIRKMWETRESLTRNMRFGVDIFLLSFCLMGMNVPDLYEAKAPKNNIITYNRRKTRTRRSDKAEAKVFLEPRTLELMSRYKGLDGAHAFNFYNRYANFRYMGVMINSGLKQWCKKFKEEPFTMYSARHTWATAAYAAGVNPAYITDGLVHRDPGRRMDDIYTKKSWERIWEANRQVLEFVFEKEGEI